MSDPKKKCSFKILAEGLKFGKCFILSFFSIETIPLQKYTNRNDGIKKRSFSLRLPIELLYSIYFSIIVPVAPVLRLSTPFGLASYGGHGTWIEQIELITQIGIMKSLLIVPVAQLDRATDF